MSPRLYFLSLYIMWEYLLDIDNDLAALLSALSFLLMFILTRNWRVFTGDHFSEVLFRVLAKVPLPLIFRFNNAKATMQPNSSPNTRVNTISATRNVRAGDTDSHPVNALVQRDVFHPSVLPSVKSNVQRG
nr:hypothetical protein [Rhodoferax sp.]